MKSSKVWSTGGEVALIWIYVTGLTNKLHLRILFLFILFFIVSLLTSPFRSSVCHDLKHVTLSYMGYHTIITSL